MPAASPTHAARNEFGRITARRNRAAFSAVIRSRVPPFHGMTLRKMPLDASSVVMCSGAAIARPPSCLNRCASARYVGRARMLSPTQFSPMTTVSLGIVRLAFARRVPLPAIVHPQPQLGARCDAPRDHVIDPRRQRTRIALGLSQFVRPYRLFKLDPMPEPVWYAK